VLRGDDPQTARVGYIKIPLPVYLHSVPGIISRRTGSVDKGLTIAEAAVAARSSRAEAVVPLAGRAASEYTD